MQFYNYGIQFGAGGSSVSANSVPVVMSILSGGNVGIGTTNPSSSLSIFNSTPYTGTVDSNNLLATTLSLTRKVSGASQNLVQGQYISRIIFSGSDYSWSPQKVGADISAIASNVDYSGLCADIIFGTLTNTTDANPTEKMRITKSGTVGIGMTNPDAGFTTAIPNAKLTIRGGAPGLEYGKARISIGGDNAHYAAIEGAHTSGGASTLAFMTCLNAGTNSANPQTRMFINSNGNIGIGLTEPGYLLHVGSITSTYNMAAYLGSGGPSNYGGGSITHATSLYINAWGISAAGWGVISDRRVKTNIEPVSNMLSIINQIVVVKYDYIDPRLGREECSVIAQELQTIFPNAINISTDYLPNIMKLCSYTKQDDIITLSVPLQSTPDNLEDIKVGSILKLVISNDDTQDKEITTPILSISFTEHTIQVSSWEDYSDTSSVIVYGTRVDDYLSIDKPQLGVMALQGVKELHQTVLPLTDRIAQLESENTHLKSQVASILAWAQTQGFSG